MKERESQRERKNRLADEHKNAGCGAFAVVIIEVRAQSKQREESKAMAGRTSADRRSFFVQLSTVVFRGADAGRLTVNGKRIIGWLLFKYGSRVNCCCLFVFFFVLLIIFFRIALRVLHMYVWACTYVRIYVCMCVYLLGGGSQTAKLPSKALLLTERMCVRAVKCIFVFVHIHTYNFNTRGPTRPDGSSG